MISREAFNLSQKIVIPAEQSVSLVGVTNGKQIEFISEDYDASQGGFEVEFLEGVTYTGGTQVFGINRNTTSPALPTLEVYAGATVSGGQLLRLKGVATAENPQARTRSSSQVVQPWLLDADKQYGLNIKNLNATPITIYASLEWVEYEML
jgi:hypothetical protein